MKKKILIAILYYTGFLSLTLLLKKIFGSKKALILCYHRVLDIDFKKFELMHGVVDASIKDFDRQMKFLSKNFNVISFSKLVSMYNEGCFPKNAVVVTFDDGYKDNYTNAYPILKKYGIPATIFLTANYIGENKLLWWDRLAYIIKTTAEKEVSFKLNNKIYGYDLSTHDKKIMANKKINALFKKINNKAKIEILDYLEKSLKVVIDKSVTKDLALSWKDIKEMMGNGIEFGAHSLTHPILTNISSSELKKEIIDSKKKIELEISSSVNIFAYPGGAYNQDCKRYVEKAGFKYACSYEYGVSGMDDDIYALKRISIDGDDYLNAFKAKIVFPRLIGMNFHSIFNEVNNNWKNELPGYEKIPTNINEITTEPDNLFSPEEIGELYKNVKSKSWDQGLKQFVRKISLEKCKLLYYLIREGQSGWKYLLNLNKINNVLIFDSTLGTITESLASHCNIVYVTNPDKRILECIRERISEKNIENVKIVHVSEIKRLPFDDDFFDFICLHNFDSMFLRLDSKISDLQERLAWFIEDFKRVLKPSGSIYLSFHNKLNFRNFKKTISYYFREIISDNDKNIFSCRHIKKILNKAGFNFTKIYSVYPSLLNARGITTKEWVKDNKKVHGIRELIKECLLRKGILSPAYIFVSSMQSKNIYLDQLMDSVFEKNKKKRIESYIIGAEHAIVSVTSDNKKKHGEKVVIKIPYNVDNLKSTRQNFETAKKLEYSGYKINQKTPRPLIETLYEGQPVFVENKIEGVAIDEPSKAFKKVFSNVINFLVEFNLATAKRIKLDSKFLEKTISEYAQFLKHVWGDASIEGLDAFQRCLKAKLLDKEIPLVFLHGDFKLENILVDPQTDLISGIIDWDLSMQESMPCLDLFHLIASRRRVIQKKFIEDIIFEIIIPLKFDKWEMEVFQRYFDCLEIDKELISSFAILYWLHHCKKRIRFKYIKYHPVWIERNIKKPFELIKQIYI